MAATNRQLNWTAVTYGAAVLTGITNIEFDDGAKILTASADDDLYDTIGVLVEAKPTAMVESLDPAAIMGIVSGTSGAFTATHKDAKAQTLGDIIYVLANAVAETPKTTGHHKALGTGTIRFIGISTDGVTNPLSFTRA